MLIKSKNTYKKTTFPIIVFSVFLLFFILLTNSVNVFASSDVITSLPLEIGIPSGLNISDSALESARNGYFSYLLNNYGFDPTSSYTVFVGSIVDQGTANETIYIICTSGFEVNTSNFPTSLSYSNSSQHYCQYTYYPASDTLLGPTFYGGWVNTWTVSSSDLANFKGWVLDHYTNDIFSSSDNSLVWTKTSLGPSTSDLDDALLILSDLSSAFTDITNPSSPIIDTNLSFIENVANLFQWLGNQIVRVVNGLASFIVSCFNLLFTNLKNFLNTIITNIHNGFSALVNNIKNFFAPILSNIADAINNLNLVVDFDSLINTIDNFANAFNHFHEIVNFCYRLGLDNNEFSLAKFLEVLFVPTTNDIDNAFTGHSLNTLYHGTVNASKVYYQFFDTVFNGSYVYIYTLPTFTLGGKTFSGYEINFDWYLQYKTYSDLIISCFLFIGYIRFLMTFINNFFYGSGFIDHDLNTIGGEKGIDYSIPY